MVNIFCVMFFDVDKIFNDIYDMIGKQLQEMFGYVKLDVGSQGMVVEVFYGFGQFVLVIGVLIIGGFMVGVVMVFGFIYEQLYQDFRVKGVDELMVCNLVV